MNKPESVFMRVPEETLTRLKELLSYDPETGVFVWKKKPNQHIVIGSKAGCLTVRGYLKLYHEKKNHTLHRLAWAFVYGHFPESIVDHINGVKTDNRICNLRLVTKAENAQNQRRPQQSNPYLGVTWSKSAKKWIAQIRAEGSRKYLGTFDTPEAAHAAYVTAKRQHHAAGML